MEKIKHLIDSILSECSGKAAYDWVQKITLYDRIKGSHGYQSMSTKIMTHLKSSGLDEIKHHVYPFDGISKTWDWPVSYSSTIKSGELWVVAPEKKRICRYLETPMCVISQSKSCDIQTELVDIGTAEMLDKIESGSLTGKIIMMTGSMWVNHKSVEKTGAVGAIVYPDIERVQSAVEAHLWEIIMPVGDEIQASGFGFSISYMQAQYLKKLLAKGKVKVHAKIDAQLGPGELELLSCAIWGTQKHEEEIIFCGHLCHGKPSANDNASGAAGILEIIRTIQQLIKDNTLKRPKRTLRFLLMPEFMATIPWMKEHEKRVKNAVACINLDMIGEHQLKIGEPLNITCASFTTPTIMGDMLSHIAGIIADHPKGVAVEGSKPCMNYRISPFAGGSDHVPFNDPFFGVPSCAFCHKDPYYHTSFDTLEMCDPTKLQRSMSIAFTCGYILADMDESWIKSIIPLLSPHRYARRGKVLSLLYKTEQFKNFITDEQKYLFGKALLYALKEYETISLEKLVSSCDVDLSTSTMLAQLKNEIKQWHDLQLNSWKTSIFKTLQIKEPIPTNPYPIVLTKNYDGPFDYYKIPALESEPVYKDYESITDNTGLGELFLDTLFLFEKYQSFEMTAAFLSMEYNIIFSPSKVENLLLFIQKKGWISINYTKM